MPSNARNLANLLGAGESTISVEKLGSDVPPGTEDYSSVDSLGVGTTIGETAFVEGSNRLYIWNGSGWYNIALINTTPTWDSGGQPAGSYVLDADSPQDATVITLAASDPEGLPISYNYITSGQMDSIATISQDSSVFTITPKSSTQAPDGGTGSITFRATDGVNILPQVSSFTLNFITTIENSKYTTLLATADGTSDNNNITDASTNNHTITVNGDAHAGTFSPYRSGGYSTYFDGTGDWLTLTSTALGNGDFTVEAWVWLDSLKDYNVIYDDRVTGSSAAGLALGVDSTGAPYLYTNNGFQITSSQTCTAKTWHHISLVRSSGVITIYLDGTSGGTYSSSANFTDTNLGIGVARTYTVTSQFGGYISDVRAVVGSAITPPSGGPIERLEAVTNTQLLTCHLPYIADGSTNSHSITVNGNVSTKPLAPYDYTEYSATDHGGSVYFDGTGDYLKIDNVDFSGDLTFECWFNQTVAHTSTYQCVFSSTTYASGIPIRFYTRNDDISIWTSGSGGPHLTTKFQSNVWYHVVVVRYSGTWTLYVNGKSVDTTTTGGAYDFSSTVDWSFGGSATGSYPFAGYVSDVRFTDSRVYTGEFSPPTAPLSTSSAKFHIKGTDASIIDKSQGSNLKLIADTVGSTTQVKFANTKSMYFDGAGDYITIENSEAYGFGTGSWTFEVWLYCTRTGVSNAIFDTRVGTGTETGSFGIGMLSTGQVQMFSGGVLYKPAETLSFNAWQHLAIVKNASTNTTTMYFNGTAAATTYSDTRDYGSSQPVQIAKDDWVNYFGGYMQDLRVTKGLARYTANFTPPTASLEG